MSTIAAGTAIGTALVSTGDTTGQLQLQVNGTTPSVTLNTAGAVGVGSTPVYGTSGQVLVSGGAAAAPAWTTLSAYPTLTGTGASGTWGISITGNAATASTATTLSITPGTAGNVLTSNGSAWVSQATSSPVTYATIIKFQ
jgi:hypothetical protein